MRRKNHDPNTYSFEEHICEVKHRLLVIISVLILSAVISWFYAADLLQYLLCVGTDLGYKFTYISPQEILVQQLKIILTLALSVTTPVIIFEGIRFVSPVFSSRRTVIKVTCILCMAMILMLVGVLFAYRVLLPFILMYLKSVGDVSNISANITVENYVSLTLTVSCIFGALFEIPLIVLLLSYTGVVRAVMLWKGGRIVTVLIFIVSAIITPPDVFSQCLVAVPLVVLYYASVLICLIAERLLKSRKSKHSVNITPDKCN